MKYSFCCVKNIYKCYQKACMIEIKDSCAPNAYHFSTNCNSLAIKTLQIAMRKMRKNRAEIWCNSYQITLQLALNHGTF